MIGNRPFDKRNLHHLLTNVAYIGRVRHKSETYEGEHEAIVEQADWQQVQEQLSTNRRSAGARLRNKCGALLKGLLRCKACDAAMIHSATHKGGRHYRYYVCTRAQTRGFDRYPAGTVNARQLDQEVVVRLRSLSWSDELMQDSTMGDCRAALGEDWQQLPAGRQAIVVARLVERVDYDPDGGTLGLQLTDEGARVVAARADDRTKCSSYV